MPVPIVSVLSTTYTGDVLNRGGYKTVHTDRVTLKGDTYRNFRFVENGYERFRFVSSQMTTPPEKTEEQRKHLVMKFVN
jgi:hypothetical protein